MTTPSPPASISQWQQEKADIAKAPGRESADVFYYVQHDAHYLLCKKLKLPPHLVELPASRWAEALEPLDSRQLVLLAVSAAESLMPEWNEKHPEDTVPPRALATARRLADSKVEELILQARVLSKACSASRRRTIGYEHRIAEAARAALNAAIASSKKRLLEGVTEALGKVEEHRVYKQAVKGTYGRVREIRQIMIDAIANGPSESQAQPQH